MNKTTQFIVAFMMVALPGIALAATSGAEFEDVYNFIYDAATGYLGRAIALVGGLIGLGIGAATGKALPAAIGVILAIFGALGPEIVNSIFGSATVTFDMASGAVMLNQ